MRRQIALTAALFLVMPLVAAAPAVNQPPPESNRTYQPTNAEWLARFHDGQEPIRTATGGPSNPSGSLETTPSRGDDGRVHVGVGEEVVFDATGSAARSGDFYGGSEIVNWIWDFADGSQANTPIVGHRYTRPGIYHVNLTVHDDTGWRSQRDVVVEVGDPSCGSDPVAVEIPTADGNVMRGFLTLPADASPDDAVPTILEYGPYVPFGRGACDDMVREGYAMAMVAAPGRAKSTGEWDMFGGRTQQGGYDAVEWLAAQPWSNGKVGLWGVSGPAVGALLTAGAQPPHLAAVVAKSSYADMYRDIITAGGVPNSDTFVNAWLPLLTAQDAQFAYGSCNPACPAGPNPGLGPNGETVDHAVTNTERQLDLLSRTHDSEWWEERSIVDYPSPTAPVLYYGNQQDLWPRATVEIQRWIDDHGGRVISVPGGHTVGDGTGWEPGRNAFHMLAGETRLWFERHLKDVRNGVDRRPPVLTWSGAGGMVADGFNFGAWEQLDGFVTEEVEPLQLHLRRSGTNPDRPQYHGLSQEPAEDGELPTVLAYSPVQGATSDNTGALATQVAGTQDIWESHSLVYETPEFEQELHVNGPATARIHARVLGEDFGFTAHVNAVWPDGSSHYVAKGALRASHRDLDEERSLYLKDDEGRQILIRAYHPHTEESVQRLVPGQVYRFDIEIWGIHNIFEEGHRLRLTLAAQDLGWRTHWQAGPAAIVMNDPAHPSVLNLPVLPTADSREPFPFTDGGPTRAMAEQSP